MPYLTRRQLDRDGCVERCGDQLGDVDVLSDAGVNWADLDVLTDTGVNWTDMDALTIPGSIGGMWMRMIGNARISTGAWMMGGLSDARESTGPRSMYWRCGHQLDGFGSVMIRRRGQLGRCGCSFRCRRQLVRYGCPDRCGCQLEWIWMCLSDAGVNWMDLDILRMPASIGSIWMPCLIPASTGWIWMH